jgi:hypothetical protein
MKHKEVERGPEWYRIVCMLKKVGAVFLGKPVGKRLRVLFAFSPTFARSVLGGRPRGDAADPTETRDERK